MVDCYLDYSGRCKVGDKKFTTRKANVRKGGNYARERCTGYEARGSTVLKRCVDRRELATITDQSNQLAQLYLGDLGCGSYRLQGGRREVVDVAWSFEF